MTGLWPLRRLACGLLAALCWALLMLLPLPAGPSGPAAMQYYYQNPCASCDEAGEFRTLLHRIVGDVPVQTYNTFQLRSQEAYQRACERLGIPQQQQALPMAVVANRYLVGKDAIADGLQALWTTAQTTSGDTAADWLWAALLVLPRGALLCAAAVLLVSAAGVRSSNPHNDLLVE